MLDLLNAANIDCGTIDAVDNLPLSILRASATLVRTMIRGLLGLITWVHDGLDGERSEQSGLTFAVETDFGKVAVVATTAGGSPDASAAANLRREDFLIENFAS